MCELNENRNLAIEALLVLAVLDEFRILIAKNRFADAAQTANVAELTSPEKVGGVFVGHFVFVSRVVTFVETGFLKKKYSTNE